MLDKRTCLAGLFRLAPIGREEGFMEGVSDGLFGPFLVKFLARSLSMSQSFCVRGHFVGQFDCLSFFSQGVPYPMIDAVWLLTPTETLPWSFVRP